MQPVPYTFDIETSGLLNQFSIDYNASPYVLKSTFKMHCVVLENHETGEIVAFYDGDTYIFDGRRYEEDGDHGPYILDEYEPVEYTHLQLDEFPQYLKDNPASEVIGHNIINFDLLACKMYWGMDYTVGPDSWDDEDVYISDTMVTSKCLNPDRFGGHSLDNLAKMAKKAQKIEFRKHLSAETRFLEFAADMLYYCIFDVKSNTAVYNYLEHEKGDWDWSDAIELEKAVAEIVTRQEHRGFKFDKNLAEECIEELDEMMEERRQRVEPLLPPRPATKKFLQEHTPPANQVKVTEIFPPKTQFKKDRSPSAALLKFVEKEGLELIEESDGTWRICDEDKDYDVPLATDVPFRVERELSTHMVNFLKKHEGRASKSRTKVKIFDVVYDLPMERVPLKDMMEATIDDTTHIKNWLVGLGWNPSEYKDKDITVKSGPAKQKRTPEELEKAVDDYVEETMNSNFCDDRMAHFEIKNRNRHTLKRKIMQQASKRSCKVLTNPSFTVGQDKEMDRDLERISEQFPYAKDVVEYLTFKHRRNSILGGGLEWEEGDEAEKGYIANLREDGRIPTPVDSCGAATSRMKHRIVANIPRVTSLYGKKMRELFGVDKGFLQIGYDFDSLEARIEAHYCFRYDDITKAYCESLILPKPLDVHTKMAEKISEIIGRKFDRSPAKNVKYGATYGAQEAKIAKTIGSDLETGTIVFNAFWEAAAPLKKLKDALASYWKDVGNKKFILGIDGRKVPTRAEHAILNSLFQSGGVICAKQAAVFHDKLLKEEGLLVDFFRDDWKNSKFCQQMEIYHDEAQLEESVENFIFKVFDTEDEAEEFRKTDERVWGETIKGKTGKFVVGYSRAAELISVAVDMTTEHFKLNVPLSAGYIIGRNWGDCH